MKEILSSIKSFDWWTVEASRAVVGKKRNRYWPEKHNLRRELDALYMIRGIRAYQIKRLIH